MKTRLLLIALLLASTAGGTTYYIQDSTTVGGTQASDANNGTSWATSVASVTRINALATGGDTIYFGAGRWNNSRILPDAGGTATDYTVYICSTGTSATYHDATICSGDTVHGWSQYSGNIYQASWTGSDCLAEIGTSTAKAYCLKVGDSLYWPEASLGEVNASYEFYHNDGTNTIYAYFPSLGDTVNVMASCKPAVGFNHLTNANAKYVKFIGLNLQMGKGGVVHTIGTTADTIEFRHCSLAYTGINIGSNAAIILHENTYTIGWSDYWLLKNCDLGHAKAERQGDNSYHNGSGIITYTMRHFVVDSCTFHHSPSPFIYYKNDHPLPSGNRGAYGDTVRFSTFKGPSWMAIRYGRYIQDAAAFGNVFYDLDRECFRIGVVDDLYGPISITNNTMYDCGGFMNGGDMGGENFPDSGEITFKYNIGMTSWAADIAFDAWMRFTYDNVPYNHTEYVIDSNLYYDGAESFLAIYNGGTWRNLTEWRALGFDVNSSVANPNFSDTAARNFARPSASGEMNQTYGGRTWTIYGAVQDTASTPPAASGVKKKLGKGYWKKGKL